MAAQLTDFNVQAGEVVIVEGEVARTALTAPAATGGKFSTDSLFVRMTNAKVVDDSKGPNLAKFIQAHISPEDPFWYTATTRLTTVNVVDNAGTAVTLKGELRRGQIVRVAINAFTSKTYSRVGSGLQAVLVPDASKLQYADNSANAATSSLFGINDVASATETTTPAETATAPAPQPTEAPASTAPATETAETSAPNPFASSSDNVVNPFAK